MLKVQSDYDYPLVIYCSYWKYVVHFQLIYPLKLKMVIFHSYVSLPQGTPFLFTFSKLFDQPHSSIHHTATFCTSNRAFKNSAASCAKQSLETCCAGRAGRCTRPGGPGRSRQVQAGRRSRSNTSHVIPQNKWIQCETRMFEGVYFILRGRLRGFHKHPMAALTGSLG